MSKSFARLFIRSFKNIMLTDTRYETKNEVQIKLAFSIFSIGACTHGIYALGTTDDKTCKIVKKYKIVRNGFTEFMVVDEQGNHYNVNNSFWYWKWNSIEDWSKIKEGDEIKLKCYGWRVPVLGLFPNIYNSKNSRS